MTTTTDRHDEARTTDRVGRGALTPARLATFALIALAVIAADQATKAVVRAWLAVGEVWPEDFALIRFARVENSGAAFGIFQDGGLFLVVASIVGVVGVALFLLWAPPHSRLYLAALALILGGAAGNLIDRVARGTVTDFVDPTHYPAFNVADSAIVVGIVSLFVLTLLDERRERRGAASAGEDDEPEREAGAGERASW